MKPWGNSLWLKTRLAAAEDDLDAYVEYSDLPCVCGHMETTHLRVSGKCRSKKCSCTEFLNEEYVKWMRQVVVSQLRTYREMAMRLEKRKGVLTAE